MDISLDWPASSYYVKSYRPGRLRLNTATVEHSIILFEQTLLQDWAPQHFAELTAADLDPIIALSPEIVLLGTGEQHHFPPLVIRQAAAKAKLVLDHMSTEAACRTYNILAAEGRAVLLAAIIC